MIHSLLKSRSKVVYDILCSPDFTPDVLISELERGHYSADEINRAGCAYAFECMDDIDLLDDDRAPGEVVPGLISSHYYEAIKILIGFGLEPNAVIRDGNAEYNIMSDTRHVVNGYESARALDLLLNHNGDPDIIIEGGSLIRDINFDIHLGWNEQKDRVSYDALVHYWFVLLGYGAMLEDGRSPVDFAPGFERTELLDHIWYTVKSEDVVYDGYDCLDIVVIDKETGNIVARM